MKVNGQELEIFINEDGSLQFVHDDDLAALFDSDESETKRASHVEPCRGGWTADLTPVGGPVLGPFTTRKAALDAELAWLAREMTIREVRLEPRS